MRWTTAAALLLLPTSALAEPCTAPTHVDDFNVQVEKGVTAFDNDDIGGFGAAFRELKDLVPCMAEPIPAQRWADLLLLRSVVSFTTGAEWQSNLDVALTIHPRVDRSWVPADLQSHTITPPSAPPQELKAGAEYYVDGVKVTNLAPLSGMHVLQRKDEQGWTSVWTDDGVIPEEWLVKAVTVTPIAPLLTSWDLLIMPTGSWGGWSVTSQDETYVAPEVQSTSVFGLILSGSAREGVGGWFDASVRTGNGAGSAALMSAYAGAKIGSRNLGVVFAAGPTTVPYPELEVPKKSKLTLQSHVGVDLRVPVGDMELVAHPGAGVSISSRHALLRATLLTDKHAGIGLNANWTGVSWKPTYPADAVFPDGFVAPKLSENVLSVGLHLAYELGNHKKSEATGS